MNDPQAPVRSPELELIYNTAPIGLAFLSRDCRYVQINQRLTEICGISVADHVGRSVRETVPAVADQVEIIVRTILETGEAITGVEVNGQRPDGSNAERVWITYWHPLKATDGSIVGVNVAAEEITERKRAQAALASSEGRFRKLAENLAHRVEAQARERDRIWNVSQDLLVVIDFGGNIASVNPAWTTILGWSREGLIGRNAASLVHPDDRQQCTLALSQLAEDQKRGHLENRLLHRDGTVRWISWQAVRDEELIYAVGRDVTELKRTEGALAAARREMSQASGRTAMGAMTAWIAHEINQQLSSIVMSADAALRWLGGAQPNIQEVRKNLERIGRAGHRTTEVIASIRSMFGKDAPRNEPIDVNAVIREVLTLIEAEIDSHHVVVKTTLLDDLPELVCERVRLQQVILNLTMNAIDSMNTVANRPRQLRIKSERHEPSGVKITVEDTGTGIDPTHADRIFDTFFTTKTDGMGLGLSICRSIVEAQGGRLWCAPLSPYGTAFYVQLENL
jgi:PAS domain S-box-containing protein